MTRIATRLVRAYRAFVEPAAGNDASDANPASNGSRDRTLRSDGVPESTESDARRAARSDGGSASGDGEVRRIARSDGGLPNEGKIKMVVAVVRPDRLAQVKTALAGVGAPSLTVTNVSGRGSQPAKTGQWRGEEYTVDLHQKVKIECVVADIPAGEVVGAIREAANTGEPGDGKIFVLPVENAVQVRTGKEGVEAV